MLKHYLENGSSLTQKRLIGNEIKADKSLDTEDTEGL